MKYVSYTFAGQWGRGTEHLPRTVPFPVPAGTSMEALGPAEAKLGRQGKLRMLGIEDDNLEAFGIFPGDVIGCQVADRITQTRYEKFCFVKHPDSENFITANVHVVGSEIVLYCCDGARIDDITFGDVEVLVPLYLKRSVKAGLRPDRQRPSSFSREWISLRKIRQAQ